MSFIALKCPSCGADINLDSNREFGFCSYCGTKIVQDKQVVEKHVIYDHSKDVINNINMGHKYFADHQWKKAYQCFEKALKWDSKNGDANKMFNLLVQRKNSPNVYLSLTGGFITSYKIRIDNLYDYKLTPGARINLSLDKGKHTMVLQKGDMMSSLCFSLKDEFDKVRIDFIVPSLSKKQLKFHMENV